MSTLPVFAVADGMGGHLGGARASAAAISALSRLAGRVCTSDDVVAAIDSANGLIASASEDDPGLAGMGTTLAGLALVTHHDREVWLTFNVGDSRIYRWHRQELSQVTVDHSLIQELLDAAELSIEEAARDPRRNVVTRALGSEPSPEVDFWILDPEPGESFLICSDGLSGYVADTDIARALSSGTPPEDAARNLVDLAIANGGHDDVTAVVVHTLSLSLTAAPDKEMTRERRSTANDLTVPRPALGETDADS